MADVDKNIEIQGLSLKLHATNVRYGKTPDVAFVGAEIAGERGYVAIIGPSSNVMRFALKVKDKGGSVTVGLIRHGDDWGAGEHFAACVLGEWPSSRLQGVVGRFSAVSRGGPGAWARIFMEELLRDPQRCQVGPPSTDAVRFFSELYDNQCEMSSN